MATILAVILWHVLLHITQADKYIVNLQETQKNKKVNQDNMDHTTETAEAGQDYLDNTYQGGSSEALYPTYDQPQPGQVAATTLPPGGKGCHAKGASSKWTTVFSSIGEHQLSKNNLIGKLPSLGKEWRLSHDFKPTKYSLDGLMSILYLTMGGNAAKHGDMTPAIYFEKGWIWVGFSRGENFKSIHDVLDKEQLPLNTWTSIKVSQELTYGGTYMIKLNVGGREIFSLENKIPRNFSNVKVFASDPWHAPQPGFIRDIVIEEILKQPVSAATPQSGATTLPAGGKGCHAKDASSKWTTVFSTFGEILSKNNFLGNISSLGKEWRVSFDFKPKKYSNDGLMSILYLTLGGNAVKHGDMTPAIYFQKGSIWVGFSRGENFKSIHDVLDKEQLPINSWTTIKVSQELTYGGTCVVKLNVGCREILFLENKNPRQFYNVKVYASDPWHAPQPGFIRNIVVETIQQAQFTP